MNTYYWSFTRSRREWKVTDDVDTLPADATRTGYVEGETNLKGWISILKSHPEHSIILDVKEAK